MQIKIDRQYLEDLNSYFIPFMMKAAASRERLHEGTEMQLLEKICFSILEDIKLKLERKKLTVQKKFTINFSDAYGIILMKALMNCPVPPDHVWRHNLRNQIIEQLDKQIL